MTYQSPSRYHGYEPETGAPFAIDARDGQLLRVETDGRGGTREQVIGRVPATSFGLPRGTAARLRANYRDLDAEKKNSGWRCARVQREILRALSERGPLTKDELASRLCVWTYQVASALTQLTASGRAECYPDESAGSRKYLWRPTGSGCRV